MADNINIPFTLYLQGIEGTEAFKRISESIRNEVAAGMRFAAAENRQPRDARGRFTSRGSAGTYGSYDKDIKGAEKLNQVTAEYVRAIRSFGGDNSFTKSIYSALPAGAKKAADALGIVQTKINSILRDAKNGKDVGKELGALFEYINKPAIKKNSAIGDLAFKELKAARQELELIERTKRQRNEAVNQSIAKGREEVRRRFDQGLQQKIRENEKFQENAAKARRERELDADIKATQKRKNMEAGVPGVTETPRDRFNQRVAFEIAEGTALVRRRKAEFADKKSRQDAIAEEKTLNQVLTDQVRVREFLAKRQLQRSRGDDKETFAKLETFANADPAELVRNRLSGRGNGRGGNGNNRGFAGGDSPDNPEKIRRLLTHAKAVDANARAFHNAGVSAERFGELAGLALKRYGAFLVGTFALTQVLQGISQATTEFYNFEKAFTVLEQVLDTSESKFLQLRKTITDVAVTTGVSATEITKGLGTLAQAGFGNADELEKVASVLAKITLAPSFDDIPSTIEGLIAIFGQFNLKLTDTQSILDKVNKLSVDYAIESRDFFEAVKRGGATFATAGGSFEEFASLLTLLRSSTRETASTLGIFFKSGLTKFNRPSSQALVETLIGKDAGKNLTLLEQFTKLAPKFSELGGTEQIQLANRLVGVQQSARLIKLLQEINKESASGRSTADTIANATGSIDASVAKRLDDVGVSMNRIRESFGKFFIELGKTDEVKNFASSLADLAQSLAGTTKEIGAILPYLGALMGFFALRKVGAFAGGLAAELRGVAGSSVVLAAAGNQVSKTNILGIPSAGTLGRTTGSNLKSIFSSAGSVANGGLAAGGLFLAAGGGSLLTNDERKQRRLQGVGIGITGGASTGAAVGAAFGPVGSIIGGLGGAAVGGISGFGITNRNIRNEDEKARRDKESNEKQRIALENINRQFNSNGGTASFNKNNLKVATQLLGSNPNLTGAEISSKINEQNLKVINNQVKRELQGDVSDLKNRVSASANDGKTDKLFNLLNNNRGIPLFANLQEILVKRGVRDANKENDSLNQQLQDIQSRGNALRDKVLEQRPIISDSQGNQLRKTVLIDKKLQRDTENFFATTLFAPDFINATKLGLIGIAERITSINEEYRRLSNEITNISADPTSTRSVISGDVSNRDLVASSFIGKDVLRNFTESLIKDTTKLLSQSNILESLRGIGVTGQSEDSGSLTNTIFEQLDASQQELIARLTTIFPDQDTSSVFSALAQLDGGNVRSFIEQQTGVAVRDEKFGEALRNYADNLTRQAEKFRILNDALDQTVVSIADLKLSIFNTSSESQLRRQSVLSGLSGSTSSGLDRGNLLRNISNSVTSGVIPDSVRNALDAVRSRNQLVSAADAQARGNGIVDPQLVEQVNNAQIAANRSLLTFETSIKTIQTSLNYATQAVDAYSQATIDLKNNLKQTGSNAISGGLTRREFDKGKQLLNQFESAGGFNDPFKVFKSADIKTQQALIKQLELTPSATARSDAFGNTTFADLLEQIKLAAGGNLVDQVSRSRSRFTPNAQEKVTQAEDLTKTALDRQLSLIKELQDAEQGRIDLLKLQQEYLRNNTDALGSVKPSVDGLIQELRKLNDTILNKADISSSFNNAPLQVTFDTLKVEVQLQGDDVAVAVMQNKDVRTQIGRIASNAVAEAFKDNFPVEYSKLKSTAQG